LPSLYDRAVLGIPRIIAGNCCKYKYEKKQRKFPHNDPDDYGVVTTVSGVSGTGVSGVSVGLGVSVKIAVGVSGVSVGTGVSVTVGAVVSVTV
jgi:hypothetical protein